MMFDNKESNHINKRLEYLEYVNRYSVDVLEQALGLFDFNLRDRLKSQTYDRSQFLDDIEKRIRKILPIEDTAFFLVNENDFDFVLTHKSKSADEVFIKKEMERMIDEWAFSNALRENRTVVVSSSDPDKEILLHAMATSSRIRGMFFALIKKEDMQKIPDISLLLISTTLLVCSNFLESIELYDILNKNNILLEKTIRERTAQLEHETYHDNLTSLPNRIYILNKLKDYINLKKDRAFAFIKIDLNRFKDINDSFGHKIGDMALRFVSEKLSLSCRDMDIVGRFGGDEFAVILPGVDTAEDAMNTASRILIAAEEPFIINSRYFQIDLSMGVSLYPKDSTDLSDIIRKADVAMYKSKREKSGISFYNPKYDNIDSFDLSIKVDLKKALETESIYPLFQPRYCFHTKKITGVEALARWNHPKHGFISPGKFIPLAEKSGLIKRLTHHIVRRCIIQSEMWKKAGIDLKIGANLSALDLQDENFPKKITNLFKEFSIDPGRIEFEITESTIMTNQEQAITNLKYLNELGFTISLDDFGTGYSSLSYLHMFPVDNIKIDLSFVRDMIDKPENQKIVQTIINLGKSLEKKTVAEGVETYEVAMMLKDMGCDCIQGYYIGKPMKALEVEALLGKVSI